ncbi:hypothetical protein FRB94_008596 [Tulasnella sp. JGI-2019a]|nr:hypothetical protein FRB94_008596 [Tulasnella sp. JGI-2019a]
MSADRGIEMPLIHSVLDQSSRGGPSGSWNDALPSAAQIDDNGMDPDTDAMMPQTTKASSSVAGFESLSVQPGGSVIVNPASHPSNTVPGPLGNTLVNGFPSLRLSSSDSHLITIQRQVALGHNSDMYQGLYAPLKLKLAMKCPRILREGTIQAADVKRRYEREVKTWSSLKHDNILPFFGVVKLSSVTYLVAPWVTHGDLSKFLAARLECLEHPLLAHDSVSVEKRAAFLVFDEAATIHGIASGLAYLHGCGMIHGDIKAANVLLGDSLIPLLGDFGCAKRDEHNATSPGSRGEGTARWKSPGLHNGESRTAMTDIYALGMTIVEILTGKAPFPQLPSSFRVCVAISQGRRPPFEPLSRHGKDFRPLWELAASCWQQEPDNRPNAAQVVAYAAPLLLTTPPCRIPMAIDSYISSGVIPVALKQVERQSNTLRGHQSTHGVFRSGSEGEPGVAGLEFQSLQSTDENNHTCNSLIGAVATYKELGDRSMVAHCIKSLGDLKRTQGYYDGACTMLQEATAIYEELGYRSMMAHCLTSVGDIKETQGLYGDAYTSLSEAATVYSAVGDRSMMAHCLRSIGVIKESQGNYDEACSSLNEAATTYMDVSDRSMTASCLKSIGDIKETQGKYDEALTLLGESYTIVKELNDRGVMAQCLQSIGWIKNRQGRYVEAYTSLSEAAEMYKELGERRRTAHCLKLIVKIQESQGDYDDACTSLEKVVMIYEELGDRNRMADCFRSIGALRESQEYYDDACASLSEAAVIYKELNNRGKMVDCLHSIVQIKEDQENGDDACVSLGEAYAICKQFGDQRMMAYCLKSIGETKKAQGIYDQAHTSLIEAVALYKELSDKGMTAHCLKLIGEIKLGQGQRGNSCISLSESATIYEGVVQVKEDEEESDDAVTSLNEAATIYKELGDRKGVADCLKSIARIKEDEEQFDDAFTSLNEAVTIYKELGDRKSVVYCLESIARIKKDQRQFGDACTSLNDAITIYKELGDRSNVARCLESIARIKKYQVKHDEACTSLNNVATIYKELGNLSRIVQCFISIGGIRKIQRCYDAAFISLTEAWVITNEPGRFRIRYQSDIAQAVEVLLIVWRQSINLILKRVGNYELLAVLNEACGMVDSLCRIGKISREEGSYGKAMESFCDANRLLKGLEGGWGIAECPQSLVVILQKQGDAVKYIQCLVRLADALGSINVPGPGESEPAHEGYTVILTAGQLLGSLSGISVPEELRIKVAQLHVLVAIAFHARFRLREARSTVLEAGRFLQQPGEELHVMENLTRLGGVLLRADYIREAGAVWQERDRVQVELHEMMPSNERYQVARKRVWQL